MVTISVCMIVKNEADILARCLDSLSGLYEELIIVDTGSTDETKEIAAQYTDQIYDFVWCNDFAAARNFAWSKASMEYIYSADADEVLDEENYRQFKMLKQVLDPAIEIVQMYYDNQLHNGTVYNFNREYRPKLYKRLRQFVWEDAVHEAVRFTPLIYDSDISILHYPKENHAGRDFSCYQTQLKKGRRLSLRLYSMYARELYLSGSREDYLAAKPYFEALLKQEDLPDDRRVEAEIILACCARLCADLASFFTQCMHNVATGQGSAEICYELGTYYEENGDKEEAAIWYLNAAFETQCYLNVHCGGDWPLIRLSGCMRALGRMDEAARYEEMARNWQLPEGD